MKKRYGLIIVVMLAAILWLLLLSSTNTSADMETLHINLKDGDRLHPETKGDPGASSEQEYIAADYDEYPGARANKRWVEVGTWTSSSLEVDCEFSGAFQGNVWCRLVDEGYDADPEFRYTLRKDGSFLEELIVTDTDPGTDDIFELSNSTSFSGFTMEKGSTLELFVEYRGWEDCYFYYDNADYDSGFTLESDFLRLYDMEACGEEVTLEVYDAFGCDWNEVKHFLALALEGEEVDPVSISVKGGKSHEVNGEEVTGTLISWELDEQCCEDDELEVWVKFTRAQSWEEKGMICGCSASDPNLEKPEASINSIRPNPVREGDEVTLDARKSSDGDGEVICYVWKSELDGTFYNGSSDVFRTTSLSSGVHGITLVVQDDDGLWSNEATGSLRVEENEEPEVELSYPGDATVVAESFLTLSWDGRDDDGDDLSYDLYLDTQSNPKDLVAEELEDESFDVEELEDGETYYWKVVASDDRDETESEVRSFTVELPKPNRLPTVTLLGPANHSVVDHRGALILSWEAEDLDGDDLQYSILVELITDKVPEGRFPVALGLGQYRDTYELTELEPGQSYEWYVYISDEEGGTRSDIRTFTTTGSSGGNDDDDDDGFEIAGANGYAVAGGGIVLAVTLMAVFLVFRPGKDEDYDDYDEDYDDYEDDEDYYL